MKSTPAIVAIFSTFLLTAALPAATVGELRCEYRSNPLGIDVARPRLSWIIDSNERGERQTAYRILVASSTEKLAQDEGDLWDSGKVAPTVPRRSTMTGKPLTVASAVPLESSDLGPPQSAAGVEFAGGVVDGHP